MLVKLQDQVPPLHHSRVAIIVITPDRTVKAAMRISDKVALLQECHEEDIVLLAHAQPWTIEVFAVSPQKALRRLQESIPKDASQYYLAFSEPLQ
jgi:hypothetical protein